MIKSKKKFSLKSQNQPASKTDKIGHRFQNNQMENVK